MSDSQYKYDVFISYSHTDTEWIVGWLVPHLEVEGLRVCIDVRDFDIGVPSLVNMERAVDHSRCTLIILTPNWLTSEWTEFEALLTQTTDPAARQRRMLPLLLQPCQPPRRIAVFTYADFTRPEIWHTQLSRVLAAVRGELHLPEVGPTLNQLLEEDVSSPATSLQPPHRPLTVAGGALQDPPRRNFYAHISLPTHYIARPKLLVAIREALFANPPTATQMSTVKSRPLALHGMGGIGKSVVTRILCDDPEVQATFPDGILWTSLGQAPELISNMREWVNVLGGTISENAPTVESLKANLTSLLEERACLLVVDDVWQHSHAEVFHVGGKHCHLLITTRDTAITEALGAMLLHIPVMTHEEAISLLEAWANGRLADCEPTLKAQIVKELGYLPLAVKLAGAQLHRKAPDEWLRTFDAHKLKSRRSEDIHDSLERTFGLSLDALEKKHGHLYAALAIFKEDEPIRDVEITRLWEELGGLDQDGATDLIDDLAARALLDIAHDTAPRTVKLHDLLRNFMHAKLGDQYIVAHTALLNAYRKTRTGPGWHTVPDDGYLYDHLAYHLDAVNAEAELKGLFADHSWMHVRLPQCGYIYDGYIDDLMVLWMRTNASAMREIGAGLAPTSAADCVRYALIRTSINSIASGYAPEIVARAVEVNLLTADQALSIAAKVPNMQQRSKMYQILLSIQRLNEQQKVQTKSVALKAALAIIELEDRVEALSALAAHLTGALRTEVLEQVLELILRTAGGTRPFLERQAYTMWDMHRARLLTELAPQLAGSLLERAVDFALGDEIVPLYRENVVEALIPQLTGELLERVLEVVAVKKDDTLFSSRTLIALARQLEGTQQAQVLQQALHVLTTANAYWRARALMELAPLVARAQQAQVLEQALQAALTIPEGSSRVDALARLAPHLARAQQAQVLEQALRAALTIPEERIRVIALAKLAPLVARAQQAQVLEQALRAALTIPEGSNRVDALARLFPLLSGTMFEQALEAIVSALEIPPESKLAGAVDEVMLFLPQSVSTRWEKRKQKMDEARPSTSTLDNALTALGPRLTEKQLERVLETVLNKNDAKQRSTLLVALAPHLTKTLLKRALDVARTIVDTKMCSNAVNTLTQRSQVTLGALDIVLHWGGSSQNRSEALEEIEQRPRGMFGRAFKAGYAAIDAGSRAAVRLASARKPTSLTETQVLQQELEAALALEHPLDRGLALYELAPRLTGAFADRAAEAILVLEYPPESGGQGIDALAHVLRQKAFFGRLVPRLTEAGLQNALRIVLANESEVFRAYTLGILAPWLTGTQLERALEAALAITEPKYCAEALNQFPALVLVKSACLKSIRYALLKHLLSMQGCDRQVLLEFCVGETFFRHPTLAPETLQVIANHIKDIHRRWRWL